MQNPWFDVNDIAYRFVGLPFEDIVYWLGEFFWIVLLSTIPLIFWHAYRHRQRLAEDQNVKRVMGDRLRAVWKVRSWPILRGLTELYISGILPWGPWDITSISEQSICTDFLERFVSMGLFPFTLQNGGVDTRQTRKFAFSSQFPYIILPQYIQSKKRAYIEFLMPYPNGAPKPVEVLDAPRRDFLKNLLQNRHGYAVTVCINRPPELRLSNTIPKADLPLEVGAASAFEPLLPFKRDEVLQPGKCDTIQELGDFIEPDSCPLLEWASTAVIRVEVPHFSKRPLDTNILGIADHAGMGRVWSRGTVKPMTREWLEDNGLDIPGVREWSEESEFR